MLSMRGGGSGDISEHIDPGRKYLIELSYDKAVIEFTEAINIDPNNVDAYLGLAEAYEKIGDIPKAIEWLEKGFSITGDPQIKEMLDRLRTLVDSDSSAVTESETAPPEETTVTESVREMSNEVRVPYLLGMTEERAIMTCESVGLKCEISYAGSDKAEKGCVFGQAIAAGTMVDRGASVPVEVSEGSVLNVELTAENLEFDYLAEFEESGWAFAVKGNVGGYVNTEGRFVEVYDNVPAREDDWSTYWAWSDGLGLIEADSEFFYFEFPFKVSDEGIYPYYNGNKWGYANINTGDVISKCKYDTVTAFNCGRGLAGIDNNSYLSIQYLFSIIDSNGNEIGDKITGRALTSGYINNIAIIGDYSESNMYDINGNIIERDIFTQISGGQFTYGNNAITYQVGSVISPIYLINPSLEKTVLIKPESAFDYSISGFKTDANYAFYSDSTDKSCGIIDKDGNILCSGKKWNKVFYFQGDNTTFVKDEIGWYMIDKNGNRIGDEYYEDADNVYLGYAAVKKNGKWGAVNSKNELNIDYKYDEFLNYHLKFNDIIVILFKQDDRIVAVDNNGMEYTNFIGNFVDVSKSNIITEKDGKYFIYSLDD